MENNFNFYVDSKQVDKNIFMDYLSKCLLNNASIDKVEKYLNVKLNEMIERKIKNVGWYLKNHYLQIKGA